VLNHARKFYNFLKLSGYAFSSQLKIYLRTLPSSSELLFIILISEQIPCLFQMLQLFY